MRRLRILFQLTLLRLSRERPRRTLKSAGIDAQATDLKAKAMEIQPIKTKRDYRRALKEVEGLMQAKRNTPAGDRLDVLIVLVEAWEAKHFPLDLPDPIEAIKYHMEQKGLSPHDLIPFIGGRNRVYEVLARKPPLTLKMIWRLHKGLGIRQSHSSRAGSSKQLSGPRPGQGGTAAGARLRVSRGQLGAIVAANRLMAIADVLEQTAPDFANPPPCKRYSKKSANDRYLGNALALRSASRASVPLVSDQAHRHCSIEPCIRPINSRNWAGQQCSSRWQRNC